MNKPNANALMKLFLRIGVGFLVLVGAIVIGINVVGLDTVLRKDCSTVTVRQTQSPSNMLIASIFTRTCEELPTLSGVFVDVRRTGEMSSRQIRIADNMSTEFELTWIADDTLEVVGPSEFFFDGDTLGQLYDVWIRSRVSR